MENKSKTTDGGPDQQILDPQTEPSQIKSTGKRVLSEKEKAILQLLRQNTSSELLQKAIGDEINLHELTREFLNQDEDEIDETQLLSMRIDLLKKSQSIKKDEDFFEKLIKIAQSDPNKDFMDPITLCVMTDPVVLSSGQVMDRSSVLDDKGNLKFHECPITKMNLESKVYPLSNLKGKLNDWLIDRFKKTLFIAEQYRDQRDKFERVCDIAETALINLGDEDTYKNEGAKYANLLMNSPYLEEPSQIAKCYIRVCKTKQKEDKDKFFDNEISQLKEKAQASLETGELQKCQEWLDACVQINKAELGEVIQLDSIFLECYKKERDIAMQHLAKKIVEQDLLAEDKEIIEKQIAEIKKLVSIYQMKIFKQLRAADVKEDIDAFLEIEGLKEENMIDLTPIKLQGFNLSNNQSTEEPKLLHPGAVIEFATKYIKIDADWIDQGWGNQKARLWLRLYRGEEVVCDKDLFGICNRNDPEQKERTYTWEDEIVNKSRPGDIYKIFGRSGGGGGHSLSVRKIDVLICAIADDTSTPTVCVEGNENQQNSDYDNSDDGY